MNVSFTPALQSTSLKKVSETSRWGKTDRNREGPICSPRMGLRTALQDAAL